MKKIHAEFKADPEKAKKENRAAIELGVSSARLECKETLKKKHSLCVKCMNLKLTSLACSS
jgi:hypothetical protein